MDDETIRPGSGVEIPVGEVQWRFSASGGPGGQHANRAYTRAEVVLDLETARGIPDEARAQLIERLGSRVAVAVDEHRSQTRNREIALQRLTERLEAALVRPRRRKPTRPSRAAKERRLAEKRRKSERKRSRRPPDDGWS